MPAVAPRIHDLQFTGEFRRYQQTVLAGMQDALANDRHHVVAPPGSGKTILGLELLRRLDAPAVVFAPTTVIQRQWLTSLERFVPAGAEVADYASADPAVDTPISVFTYQLIATPDAATEALDDLALERWRTDLADGTLDTPPAERIETIRTTNPDAYRTELSRRRQAIRRELLHAPGADVYELLHPNARALIDRIAARGVRTIVLDECHHLLDYWAIVLRALVARLDSPRTIGLTATLPDLETAREHENYLDLVGPVDFETPVPAVVREGHLAPYRDLVLFVEPTERERTWLDGVASELARATADVTASPAFHEWFDERLGGDLRALLDDDGPLLVAAMRSAAHGGRALPPTLTLPADLVTLAGDEPPTLDDHVQLLAAFVLERLVPSADPADHELATRLRSILRTFGATVTERGLRRSRSPGDLLLAASDARIEGAARILEREHRALGADLRAVVVTDFDRDRSGVQVVDDVIGSSAGGARRIAQLLAEHPELAELGIVLVTGQHVTCTAAHAGRLREALVAIAAQEQLELAIELDADPDAPHVVTLAGSGRDWRPGVYVPLVTRQFVDGAVRVVVGTRALLGEGWDAPAANVLVDLTSVASAQAVQQLRGRTMRLDPLRPDKVAHNWDVVCVDPRSRDGDPDLRRFRRRHERLWGLVPPVADPADVLRTAARIARTPAGAFVGPTLRGELERLAGKAVGGLAHVDPLLAVELDLAGEWTRAGFEDASRRSLAAAGERVATAARWRVGHPFDDEIREGTRLRAPSEVPITAQVLRRIAWPLLLALGSAIAAGFAAWAYGVARLGPGAGDLPGGGALLLVALLACVVGFAWRPARDLYRLAVHGVPPDEVLVDSARALFDALRASGIVHEGLPDDVLRTPSRAGEVACWLEGASVADAATFAEALTQLHAPVVDQRWLIERTDGRVPAWMGLGVVRLARRLAHRRSGRRPTAWLAVPGVLARSERRREAFAAAWARRVGGGRVVDARSAEGTVALARARAMTPSGRGIAEAWRSWS